MLSAMTYFRLLPLLALLCTGCNVATGPVLHDTKSIPKDDVATLRTELNMGAGELNVDGGSTGRLDAEFDFTGEGRRPSVKYSASGDSGTLKIEEPSGTHTGNSRNQWKIRLNDAPATDFHINMGAGDATLNLGSMAVRGVDLQIGAGNLKLDLRGQPKEGYGVNVNGGAGNADVYLPASAGLYVEAGGGLGSVDVRGLHKEGGHWENDQWGKAAPRIRVNIHGGVGSITVRAE